MGEPSAPGARVTPSLSLRGIGKSFHGVTVLEGVDLDVAAGEVHAVVGENGAGKSTLMKIVAGVYAPSDGVLELDGVEHVFSHPSQARAAGVSIVYQELNLLPERTVAENLYLGVERTHGGRLDRSAMERGAAAALHAAGAPAGVTPRTKAKDLPVAAQQVVEIARALMANARIVIFDEPTAALSGAEADELFARVRQLSAAGIAIVYVSHRLPEVFALSDRITVLKDGRRVATVATKATNRDQIVSMMVGRELSNYYPERGSPGRAAPVRLRVAGGANATLHDIDLELRAGEIVGLAGLAGSGRTELAQAMFGVEPFTSGVVELDGKPVRIRSPRDAVQLGLAFVTEDRKTEGLVLGADRPGERHARAAWARLAATSPAPGRCRPRRPSRAAAHPARAAHPQCPPAGRPAERRQPAEGRAREVDGDERHRHAVRRADPRHRRRRQVRRSTTSCGPSPTTASPY